MPDAGSCRAPAWLAIRLRSAVNASVLQYSQLAKTVPSSHALGSARTEAIRNTERRGNSVFNPIPRRPASRAFAGAETCASIDARDSVGTVRQEIDAPQGAVEEYQHGGEPAPASLVDPLLRQSEPDHARASVHGSGPRRGFLNRLVRGRAAFGKDVGRRNADLHESAVAAQRRLCVRRGGVEQRQTREQQ